MVKHFPILLFTTACILLFAGCSDNSSPFSQKTYTSKDTEITAVRLDVRDREISVSPSKDSQIHIDYFENEKEFYNLSVSDEHVLTMTAADNKKWKDYIGSKPDSDFRKISLQIPDALLSELTLSTTNADIQLSAFTVQNDISLSANGGNLLFEKLDAGKTLNLSAKNGDISGSILGGYDDFSIACEIKKGDTNLPAEKKGGNKTLEVSNNNGDIDIQFIKN